MPPHVAYELTPMGSTLLCATAPLVEWSSQNLAQITEARAAYDGRTEHRRKQLRLKPCSGRQSASMTRGP